MTKVGPKDAAISAYSDLYNVAVEVTGKVAQAATTALALDPGLPPPKAQGEHNLAPELPAPKVLSPKVYTAMVAEEQKHPGSLVRNLALQGGLELPQNRVTAKQALKPLTVADALAKSDPADYTQRRRVAYAFIEGASEPELSAMINALGSTKGKSTEAIVADQITILNLICFPRDAGVTRRLVGELSKFGMSQQDVDEHQTGIA